MKAHHLWADLEGYKPAVKAVRRTQSQYYWTEWNMNWMMGEFRVNRIGHHHRRCFWVVRIHHFEKALLVIHIGHYCSVVLEAL